MWILAISLAHPAGLMQYLSQKFSEIVLVKETSRIFRREEYDALTPGGFGHLLALRALGQAEFQEIRSGQYLFHKLFIRAAECRTP